MLKMIELLEVSTTYPKFYEEHPKYQFCTPFALNSPIRKTQKVSNLASELAVPTECRPSTGEMFN